MLARIVARVNNRYEISECFLRHNQITVERDESCKQHTSISRRWSQHASAVFIDLSARTSHRLAEKYRTGRLECAYIAAGAMNWKRQR